MDTSVVPGKVAPEANKGRDDLHEEDMETEQTKAESPTLTAKADETPEKVTEKQQAKAVPVDEDSLCSVCGFVAKCPRALKIHFARRHGGSSKSNNRQVKPVVKQSQQTDPDELLAASSDSGKKSSDEPFSSPQRRVSKRTPKPKIIHSCNSCGEEFLGKSLLDLHIQKYHVKDPSEYTLCSVQIASCFAIYCMLQYVVFLGEVLLFFF